MHKLSGTLAAAVLAVSPLAIAETGETITTDIKYDASLLATPEGVSDVLASIQRQAKRACRTTALFTNAPTTDEVCVNSVVTGAVEKILDVQDLTDTETARVFASLTSATEQR